MCSFFLHVQKYLKICFEYKKMDSTYLIPISYHFCSLIFKRLIVHYSLFMMFQYQYQLHTLLSRVHFVNSNYVNVLGIKTVAKCCGKELVKNCDRELDN